MCLEYLEFRLSICSLRRVNYYTVCYINFTLIIFHRSSVRSFMTEHYQVARGTSFDVHL